MIETVISSRNRSIGSMEVRRVLPYAKRRSVGPFVFVDDFGPIEIVTEESMDVLPHPHIGLATVSYLFSGRMTHRDSIGSVQVIRPGDVNWMTAGSGIVHSERVSDAGNAEGDVLRGLQTWVALPETFEETDPDFSHTAGEELPETKSDGIAVKIILGKMLNLKSPVETLGEPFYAVCRASEGSLLELPPETEERGVYVVSGMVTIGSDGCGPGELAVLKEGVTGEIKASADSTYMLLGGPRIEKQRFMFWNFVSSSRDRIEAAKEDWKNGRFEAIPGETGSIPLPS